jgi:hypothetical protein
MIFEEAYTTGRFLMRKLAELDRILRGQWSWGSALDVAVDCEYAAVERFLLMGRVNKTDDAYRGHETYRRRFLLR